MGKGIAAAILMSTVRAVLRTSARDDDQARALATAAATLEEDLEETGTFVTLLHAGLDPAASVVSCTDAGHGLTLLVRADGRSRRIATRGLPLGTLPGVTWEPVHVPLALATRWSA
ncbi:MAG: serine/threonine-protein phosphatase [Actinomycetota bacterium]|nr:serine/threonine-protein phosphatase [Actinomycetota bacterium]